MSERDNKRKYQQMEYFVNIINRIYVYIFFKYWVNFLFNIQENTHTHIIFNLHDLFSFFCKQLFLNMRNPIRM